MVQTSFIIVIFYNFSKFGKVQRFEFQECSHVVVKIGLLCCKHDHNYKILTNRNFIPNIIIS